MSASPIADWERHRKTVAVTVILAALLYFGVAVYSGWQEVWSAAVRIGAGGLLLALALSLTNYGVRSYRWSRYLTALGHPLQWRINLNIYLAGFALTTTPGKSGELVRSLLLKQHGVRYSTSVAAFVAERANDLMALLALMFIGTFSHPNAWIVSLVTLALISVLFIILRQPKTVDAFHRAFEKRGWKWLTKQAQAGVKVANDFRLCTQGNTLWLSLLLGVLAWGTESTGFYLIAHFAGNADLSLGWGEAVFIYTFATLVGALSLLPAGVGSAEVTMLGLLIASGSGYGEAVAITVIARMATLWFGVSIGIIALARQIKTGK